MAKRPLGIILTSIFQFILSFKLITFGLVWVLIMSTMLVGSTMSEDVLQSINEASPYMSDANSINLFLGISITKSLLDILLGIIGVVGGIRLLFYKKWAKHILVINTALGICLFILNFGIISVIFKPKELSFFSTFFSFGFLLNVAYLVFLIYYFNQENVRKVFDSNNNSKTK